MAEEPSSSNPFLGKQPVLTPEKPVQAAGTTPAMPPVSVSSNSLAPSPNPEEEAENFIPTPASKWRHKAVRRGAIAFGLVAIIAGVVYWWFRSAPTAPVETVTPAPTAETKPAPPNLQVPETVPVPEGNANYTSENFKAGEIVIGGELQFLVDEAEVGPLTIENIRGEAFTEKSKKEVKLVVTWTTNKLAQAAVRYSKGVGQSERSVEEDDYSYNHSVIVSGLDPASTYLYTIDAVDRYGNRAKSDPHAVFTGARTVSLFDLIAGALGDVFGWAVTDK